jgi:hypothetical protein
VVRPVSPGDQVIVFVNWSNGATISSVTDQFGNTYTLAASATSTIGIAIYYATMPVAESPTITVSFGSAVVAPEIEIYEFSGIAGIDTQVTNSGRSSSVISGSVTTSSPGDLLFGACAAWIVTGGEAGWQVTFTPNYNCSEWLLPNSTGTYQATWSQNSTRPYAPPS